MAPLFKELKGKVVVITGGGGILCRTMAVALGSQGARVAILDLDLDKATAVEEEINNKNGLSKSFRANVLDKESLLLAHKDINEEFGPCDILINGAGGNHPKGTTTNNYFLAEDLKKGSELTTFFDLNYESMQFVFNLNYLGTLLPTQIFAKDMIGRKGCSVINISSMNALIPLTKIPAYSGAKAAVSNFTKWLAVHFSKVDIRVNALAPGFFLTDQNRALLTEQNGSLTERGKIILDHTPMGKFGEPEDLIGPLLWLCSDGSKFVTGIVVPIDGGFSSFSGV